MARVIPWNEIPDKNIFESGNYIFKIKQIKELPTDDGLLTYLGVFECEEPADMSGVPQMERYQVGIEEDPDASQPLTWRKSRGAQNLKKLLNAARVPVVEDDELMFESAKEERFCARIVKSTSAKDGQEYSNIRGYYSVTSPEALGVGKPKVGPSVGNGAPAQGTPMKCAQCGLALPRSEYGAHILTHRAPKEPTTAQAS